MWREIVTLRVDAIQDKRGQFAKSPWYASAAAGRSALVGSGIHEVDLVRHLVGRPIRKVTAFSNRIGPLVFASDISAGVRGAVDAFVKAIVERGQPAVSTRDAFDSLAACVAADRSAETGAVTRPESLD